nr:hypothetical protein [Amylibacter sp.]
MRNPMLEMALAEGHKPRHKMWSAPSSKFQPKGNSESQAKLFISEWKGGPFTANDILATIGKSATASRDSGRRVASYLVLNGLAHTIGKIPSSNATIYALTGVSP